MTMCAHIPTSSEVTDGVEFAHETFDAKGHIEVPEHAHRTGIYLAWLEADHHWSPNCPICRTEKPCMQWISTTVGGGHVQVIHGVPRIHHN